MKIIDKMLEQTEAGFLISPETAVVVNEISDVLGFKDTKVNSVLVLGVPMMTAIAADDPEITGLLYKESKKNDRVKKPHRKFATKDFFAIFGGKGRSMNEAIAEEAGLTYGDVNVVMALFLPTYVDAIEEENPHSEEALSEMFRADADQAKSDSPGFAEIVI
jgi:hypothetical protein